jgi:tRNA threonylcarbamoyladenosine biosynthesis protein TsaB
MTTLAFDTATRATTVALCGSDGTALEARDDPTHGARPRHAQLLLVLTDELLRQAGIGWPEIGRVAVGTGPGTFTGLRIGIATARALARARALPLVGVSTLQSLSLNARTRGATVDADAVIAVIDARRSEVFAAGWTIGEAEDAVTSLLPARVCSPEELADWITAHKSLRWLAIGDGAVEFREVLEQSGAVIPKDSSELHRVTAINHCRLAVRLPADDIDRVRPEYLRVPDAELARRAKGKR